MPSAPPSSAIIIQPLLLSSSLSQNVPRMPTSISIYPVALFSILDHYLRRKDDQDRVIGTLFGTRTETHVAIRTSFAVLPSETSKQVVKVNSQEVIVGWYPTGSHLKTYPALIQNFYSQETAPYQAVHIPLDYGVEPGQLAGVKGYISSPVGIFPKPENCLFVPIPVELRFRDSERSGGNAAIGRYLMDTLCASTEGDTDLGGSAAEKGGFSGRLQDTLMVDVLSRLALVSAA
ncbi:eukaryotic translation initiation factor 3 [Lentinula edodes]|nr:eukaryotic translation initiation factor 3 [Lentinula edodes]